MNFTFSPDVIALNPHLFRKPEPRPATPSFWRSEREFMAAVIAECDLRAIGQPEYGLIYHNANENAHRQPGVRAGVPDLFLPVVRVDAWGEVLGGLYIELKVGSGKCSQAQGKMHHRLRQAGYRVAVVWDSVETVMQVIEEYLRVNL